MMGPAYFVDLLGVLQKGIDRRDHDASADGQDLDATQREARGEIDDEALKENGIEDLVETGGNTHGTDKGWRLHDGALRYCLP